MSIENRVHIPHEFTNVKFLTHEFKKMLDEAGIALDNLVAGKIYTVLSSSTILEIYVAIRLAEKARLFESYGVLEKTTEEMPVCASDGSEEEAFSYKSIDNHRRVKLNAYCPDKETIILWQDEYYEGQPNDMFGDNLKAVLRAMTRVMSFDDVLESKTFENLILRG